MLFIMRYGIKPIWEYPKNRNGGCFFYKISSKDVHNVWKELTYVMDQNPEIVMQDIKGLSSQGCFFKKHIPEYQKKVDQKYKKKYF